MTPRRVYALVNGVIGAVCWIGAIAIVLVR